MIYVTRETTYIDEEFNCMAYDSLNCILSCFIRQNLSWFTLIVQSTRNKPNGQGTGFRMWDENTTVSKRAGHPYFDWPSDGSCHSQALSQLNTKLAEQLAGTAYSLQLTVCSVQCTLPQ